MYLLDGSFISGVTPYVDIDSVIKHPLWGSHLLLNNEDAVICGHKDYIRGYCYIRGNGFCFVPIIFMSIYLLPSLQLEPIF